MTAVAAVVRLLGGSDTFESEPHSAVELIDQLRAGLPFRAYEALLAHLAEVPGDAVGAALGVPLRTLHRRKASGRLAPDESERVVRVARVVIAAEEVLGGVDRAQSWLLKPNRGLQGRVPLALLDQDVGEMMRMMEINYGGTATVTAATLPGMLERGRGELVNFASLAGWIPQKKMGAYCATKFAVVAYTEALWQENRGRGVKFACVCPPAVSTPMLPDFFALPENRLAVSFDNVTEGRQIEEAHRAIFERTHDTILIIDPDTEVVLETNPAAEAVYGQDIVGMSMFDLSLNHRPGMSARIIDSGFVHFETTHRRADGAPIHLDVHARPIVRDGRNVVAGT